MAVGSNDLSNHTVITLIKTIEMHQQFLRSSLRDWVLSKVGIGRALLKSKEKIKCLVLMNILGDLSCAVPFSFHSMAC